MYVVPKVEVDADADLPREIPSQPHTQLRKRSKDRKIETNNVGETSSSVGNATARAEYRCKSIADFVIFGL